MDKLFVRLLIRPNLALQKLTTREPDIAMVDTAITAFNTMLLGEKSHEQHLNATI